MNILFVVLIGVAVFVAAYFTYGAFLAKKVFKLDDKNVVPSVEFNDGVDFDPIPAKFLAGQHFSAIAAAGPITGPIIAGMTFGWLPTLLWIIVGSIFIGGTHDMGSLVVSVRNKARSISDTMRICVSKRVWLLFNLFIFFTLIMIIVAFTDITTSSFVNTINLETDEAVVEKAAPATTDAAAPAAAAEVAPEKKPIVVGGGAIATSSILYLILPIIMGFLLRYTKLSLKWATIIFLPLVGVAIWVGPYIPFNLQQILGLETPQAAQKIWNVIVLAYCFIAAIVPVWALLQPRGHLGGYFLYAALAVSFIGILFGGFKTQYPAFTKAFDAPDFWRPMVPMLFITVACGACSGFHSLVSSGTTSKQLAKESDAKVIGYGMMLTEGVVAIIALATVMILPKDSELLKKSPNFIYASGLGQFMKLIGVNPAFGISFGLMAFTTFVYDTLDICTRLGRYIIEELTGWKNTAGRIFSTVIVGGIPLILMSLTLTDPTGKVIPAWSLFWKTFGASNQLLAALALIGVTVWLRKEAAYKKAWWFTFVPAIFMFFMATFSLIDTIIKNTVKDGVFAMPAGTNIIVPAMSLIYLVLAIWLAIETVITVLMGKAGQDYVEA